MAVSPMPATGSTALGARQSKTWNIPQKPCPWAPLGGPAWYFSHNFRPMPIEPIELSADSSSNLDGSIKPSSIPRLEESQNLQQLMTTPLPGPCLPISLVTCTKLYQSTIWALIHGSESNACHGQHSPRRETIQNLKYTPKTVSLGPSGRAGMVFQS